MSDPYQATPQSIIDDHRALGRDWLVRVIGELTDCEFVVEVLPWAERPLHLLVTFKGWEYAFVVPFARCALRDEDYVVQNLQEDFPGMLKEAEKTDA